MRCLIDTNILISATLFPMSVPAKAFSKAVSAPHIALISDYSLEEMRRVYERKFPHKLQDLEEFLSILSSSVDIVSTPTNETQESSKGEQMIRDVNDRPIYRAAVVAKADVIITGDKDLLDSGIVTPKILTATNFLHV